MIERRRHAARSGRIGAQREGHQSGRRRDRRTGTRTAADIVAIVDRSAGAIGAARADKTGRELVEIGLADQDRARVQQALHDEGGFGGIIGEGRTGGGGRKPRDIDVVLDREGHAGQRQPLPGCHARIHGLGRGKHGGFGHAGNPDLRLHGFIGRHTRQGGPRDGNGRAGARLHGSGNFDDGKTLKFGHIRSLARRLGRPSGVCSAAARDASRSGKIAVRRLATAARSGGLPSQKKEAQMTLTDTVLKPVTTEAAWRGDELAKSPDWLYFLTEEQVDQLETIGKKFIADDPDLRFVQAADYPVPWMQKSLASWQHDVDAGRGFVLVRGLRPHLYSDALSAAIFYILALHMGDPMQQNEMGDLIDHVYATSDKTMDDPGALPSKVRDQLVFHSDSSDVVALMCLRPGKSGGASLLVSGAQIYNEILEAPSGSGATAAGALPLGLAAAGSDVARAHLYLADGQSGGWRVQRLCGCDLHLLGPGISRRAAADAAADRSRQAVRRDHL